MTGPPNVVDTLALHPGEDGGRVAGRYHLKRSLGHGASKEVFLAHDLRLDREVALGRIRLPPGNDRLSERVAVEIRTTARLGEHPHIVTVYDVVEEDGVTWIVSQLVRGGSLAALLDAHPAGMEVGDAVRIAAEVVDALHYAHAHNVIHRDVKPSNVLLASPNNTALLADFGVAFVAEDPAQTVDSALVGTVAYMSPEQALGEAVDGRSDVYALGAMLFELVCGRPPFLGATMAALIAEHLHRRPPSPSTLNPRVSAPLDDLILRFLAKRPEDRPSSAAAARNDLLGLLRPSGGGVGAARRRGDPIPATLSTASSRPFIGRREALDALNDMWRRAATDRPHLAVLSGEAGIGKTSLASAFARGIDGDGSTVLYGRSDEDPLVSYQPFVEALRQLIVDRPGVVATWEGNWAEEAVELARLVPELRPRLTERAAARGEGRVPERYQVFEALIALFAEATREGHVAARPRRHAVVGSAHDAASASVHALGPARSDGHRHAAATPAGRARPSLQGLAGHRAEP